MRKPIAEVRDPRAWDICSLHVVLQGSHQMGEFLGRRRRRRRRHHLKVQVDILAGELYLEFVPMELGPWDTLGPGFWKGFRYLSYGQSGLAWGAIFEKNRRTDKIHFLKTCVSKKSRNGIARKKK